MFKVNKLKSLLSKEFDMKDLGATKKILGMEIHRDRASGPDLAHVVSVVSKFLSNPGRMHWDVVKWIFRYLTTDHDIMFSKQQSDSSIRGYVDADYAGDLDDRRKYSKVEAAKESLWLTGLVKELGIQ
ncbi:Retrovirus-related Pol polyprotein from transposon TNT 1-94 [Vitis vinifera]|uniref:Retrovirus-related Pol polyprotein from transposon TNT 1-94 n=1 Tax=Vitis vinifera TaxID=29760 RepID=A0A438H8A8_VITVI|nr:Retrovirus-related Pol polyprotein from transposon TNT 1-94 [Vitis vinifera]